MNYASQRIKEGLARRQCSAEQLAVLERELAGLDAISDHAQVLQSELAWQLKGIDHLGTEPLVNSSDWVWHYPDK